MNPRILGLIIMGGRKLEGRLRRCRGICMDWDRGSAALCSGEFLPHRRVEVEKRPNIAKVCALPPLDMRTFLPLCAAFLFSLVSSARSEDTATPTALGALKLLPRSEARNIAR